MKCVRKTAHPEWDSHYVATLVGQIPTILLKQLNTHSYIRRNVSSNRAMKTADLCEQVLHNTYIPTFTSKKPGAMWAVEPIVGQALQDEIDEWLFFRDMAVEQAMDMAHRGIAPEVANRPLELYQYSTVVMTSDSYGWERYFKLRISTGAQSDHSLFAQDAKAAIERATANRTAWHMPVLGQRNEDSDFYVEAWGVARASYNKFGEYGDYDTALRKGRRLADDGHLSCFDHAYVLLSNERHRSYLTPLRGVQSARQYLALESD